MNGPRALGSLAVLTAVVVGGVTDAGAERLAARRYTAADGLASDYIVSIYSDSRGFLWFSTRDGLSRFDGLRFTSYGVADGLPAGAINRVLETRAGVHWIATNGSGIYRFNPRGRRPTPAELYEHARGGSLLQADLLFTQFRVNADPATNRVNVLLEDRAGKLWVGTDDGLFEMQRSDDRGGLRRVDLPLPADVSLRGVHTLLEDSDGSLWIGGGWGLLRRLPDGRAVDYRVEPKEVRAAVDALWFANERELWVGFRSGLMVLETDPASRFGAGHPLVVRADISPSARQSPTGGAGTYTGRARWYTTADGLPHDPVMAVHRAADGRIWVGTIRGVALFDGTRFRSYTTANGLADNYITWITSDRAGNLWIGTVAGATRLIPNGLVTFDETDGLARVRIHSLGQGPSADVVVVSGDYMLSQFDGTRFTTVRPQLPVDARCTWMSPCGYLDHTGEWWLPTNAGVYRFAKVERLPDLLRHPPRATYTARTGLPSDSTFKVYEDRQGDVWIATSPGQLAQWQRSTGAWRAYTEADGLPPIRGTGSLATAFAEDRGGSLWVGFYDGGLARLHDGRFERFGPADGVPVGLITALHLDSAGRLWIGTNQAGLSLLDPPEASRPVFVPVSASANLASTNVRCITEDNRGRIYAGTSRGVDRIDPKTGHVRHFGVGEGLAAEFVSSAFRDRHGVLWFGTMSGVSRLDPSLDMPSAGDSALPPTSISVLRVRGVAQPVSELGETESGPFTLSPDQNQLEIGFFTLTMNAGESLKYQYRIEGVDPDWSAPSDLRSVNYGRLPAGWHRFQVRSVRSDGVVSRPAIASFTVLPPIYARWWFITLAITIAAAAAFAFYRMRVAQLVRVERVRARIATDLHDDIGASLSQIAILAEVARAQGPAGREADGPLARIADTSRALVDSMSDIVWAVNPEVDALSDLVHRMRRFAEDTLGASDIDLTFRAPSLRQDPSLGPDLRREIFLILKESITNIAKHARCTRVTIDLETARGRLRLRVTDDGTGFDPAGETDGNGLANMRRRVAALGGKLDIRSTPGSGTTTELDVQL
jgi:ligand-binding sensor domain-containing protein/two-component sensor histidine kinase